MYNVAFRYTRAAGGFEGVVTWTAFESREDFVAYFTDEMKVEQEVVEEGISEERCVELVKKTPDACYLSAAVQKSMDRDGKIMPGIFEMELAKSLFAIANKRR